MDKLFYRIIILSGYRIPYEKLLRDLTIDRSNTDFNKKSLIQ